MSYKRIIPCTIPTNKVIKYSEKKIYSVIPFQQNINTFFYSKNTHLNFGTNGNSLAFRVSLERKLEELQVFVIQHLQQISTLEVAALHLFLVNGSVSM